MSPPILIHHDQGIFLPELDLWLDARPGRPRAFVSHAHSDHVASHKWMLCSPATHRIVESRYRRRDAWKAMTLEWEEPWETHGHELRLLPAGHILGSAMLHITRKSDGATLLYTGDFKLRQGFSCESAKLLPADTLIMETTFGLPGFRFPAAEQVALQIRAFVMETLRSGEIPMLLGYSLGKAQELLVIMKDAGVPIMLHPAVARVTRVYEELCGRVGEWKAFHPGRASGHALIFPPAAGRSVELPQNARTAMITGWGLDPAARYRYQVDKVFPLSDHADYGELLECVERVRPKRVYTVHGYASEFAADLRSRGYEAWSLIGSNQLELFQREELSPGQ